MRRCARGQSSLVLVVFRSVASVPRKFRAHTLPLPSVRGLYQVSAHAAKSLVQPNC